MEFMDIVNNENQVIGNASINDIYAKKLTHRIVHILIFNNKGEMAIHFRSKHKSFCPLHWSTAVGGHVQKGETPHQAAIREMDEELRISPEITLLFADEYFKGNHKKFLSIFKTIYNGPFNENPEEVVEVKFFTIEKLKEMINNNEKFHPELLYILKKHYF